MSENLDLPLQSKIVDGVLIIEIGRDVACFAFENHPELWDGETDKCRFKVTNADAFLQDVMDALNDEREDGSTLITDMLDAGTKAAAEDGSEGIDYTEPTGEKP